MKKLKVLSIKHDTLRKNKLQLTINIALKNDPSAAEFSRQLLELGNDQIPVDVSIGLISFPEKFCFTSSKEDEVFPGLAQNYKNLDWIGERAILAAKNEDVDSLNLIIQSQIAGQLHTYKSVDCVTDENEATNCPTEFLNSLDLPGTPPHNLQLKVGAIIIMLRNLNPPKLCNGTRLSVKKLMNNVIQSTINKGTGKQIEKHCSSNCAQLIHSNKSH